MSSGPYTCWTGAQSLVSFFNIFIVAYTWNEFSLVHNRICESFWLGKTHSETTSFSSCYLCLEEWAWWIILSCIWRFGISWRSWLTHRQWMELGNAYSRLCQFISFLWFVDMAWSLHSIPCTFISHCTLTTRYKTNISNFVRLGLILTWCRKLFFQRFIKYLTCSSDSLGLFELIFKSMSINNTGGCFCIPIWKFAMDRRRSFLQLI